MSWENPSSGPGMGDGTQPSQCSDKKPGRCSMDQKLRVREMETSAEGRVCHRPAMPDANHHWWGNEHIHVHTGALSLGWGRCCGDTPAKPPWGPRHHRAVHTGLHLPSLGSLRSRALLRSVCFSRRVTHRLEPWRCLWLPPACTPTGASD